MNKVLIALLTSLTAVSVYAADDSNKSRVDVKSDASAANKKGDVVRGESDMMAKVEAKLSKEEMVALRSMVKAEGSAANKKGDVAHGEVDSLGAKAQAKLSKEEMVAVRATVKAEAAAANKKGEITKGEITKDKK